MREVNRSVLLDLLRKQGPLSRGDLIRMSALAKPTVCAIVDNLLTEGLVIQLEPAPSQPRAGRPSRMLAFNNDAGAFAGLEFGANTTRVSIADGVGKLLHTEAVPTITRDPERSVRETAKLLRKVMGDAGLDPGHLRAVGVAVAGLVEADTGICVLASNLGWSDVPLRAMVEAALGTPTVVVNRTAAATWAEGREGAAAGHSSYVWVYTGTGIGAGVVVDGALISGTSGFAGEIGHCPVVPEGELCRCGNRGCLETVAGLRAITAAASEAYETHKTNARHGRRKFDGEAVARLAAEGDATAVGILEAAGEALGWGIAYLVNILNPSLVVIGGPLSRAGANYLGAVQGSAARHTLAAEKVPVVPTTLGGLASLTGAVHMAIERHAPSYRIVDITAS
ncbi:MAG: ROK family protein [Candidatus Dormibacteria bacterium]